ncbi:TPR repeat protein [Candidatus Burarchaeum australiense]|nr:TPR repeat protein [Candidatus Burarchaeum australiense]
MDVKQGAKNIPPWLLAVLFFCALILFTYPLARGSTIVSNVGDDKPYLTGSYYLAHFHDFSAEEKWNYFYFHIHKPMIISLTALLHWSGLSSYWFVLPFIFYILGGVFLFLFLEDKIKSKIVLLGTVLILLFNGIWMYFGMHLLPDIPLATSLLAMLYFLDKSVRPEGGFSRNHWHLTALLCAIAALFRIEVLPVFLVPLLYYGYIKYRRKGTPCMNVLREMARDKEVQRFILIFFLAIVLFYFIYLYLIEKTTNFLDYPGILFKQVSRVRDETLAIGANKGQLLYPLSETILSFTILPFIVSLAGLGLLIKNREKVLYPSAILFVGLLLENSLLTLFYHGEQRYVTRLFPLLAIFLAYFVDNLLRTRFLKSKPLKVIVSILLMLLLLFSSFFLVHRGLGPDQLIMGYLNPMLTSVHPGPVALSWDLNVAAGNGYLFVRDSIRMTGNMSYERLFVNTDPSPFAEYVKVIDNKQVLQLNQSSLGQVRASDLIVVLRLKNALNITAINHGYYSNYNMHVYILNPEQLARAAQAYPEILEDWHMPPLSAEEYHARAFEKVQKGDYAGAILDLDRAIELKSNFSDAYTNRGGANAMLENYTGAMEDFNKALELDPENVDAYYDRGLLEGMLGDNAGAKEDLDKAHALNSSYMDYDAMNQELQKNANRRG